MSVTYTTVAGMLVHEIRGGVETEYTPDALGNLIECHGPDGVSTYTADYWPYGEVRTSTRTNPSPWGQVTEMWNSEDRVYRSTSIFYPDLFLNAIST